MSTRQRFCFAFGLVLILSGTVSAIPIDVSGSRMEVQSADSIVLRGVRGLGDTYSLELRWNSRENKFIPVRYEMEAWDAHAPVESPTYWAGSAVFKDEFYLIGGSGRESSIDVYNPVTNSWSAKADHSFSYGEMIRAISVGSYIYVLENDGPFWRYDPSQDVWTALASGPTTWFKSELAEVNGTIYVFGGYTSGVGPDDSTWGYTIATGSWTEKAPMRTARYAAATAVAGGRVYVFGGNYGSTVVEIFDPVRNSWTDAATLPCLFGGWDVAAPSGDKIVLSSAYEGTTYLYAPASDTYERADDIMTRRGSYTTGDVLAGRVYVAGGQEGGDRLESYLPGPAGGAVLRAAASAQPGAPEATAEEDCRRLEALRVGGQAD